MKRLSSARIAALVVLATTIVAAQNNRIDVVSPMAPELAAYGKYDIGVRTIQVTDKNRIDVLNTKAGEAAPRYDRTLTLEVWYPAKLATGQKPGGDYTVITRDPSVTAVLHGKAVRDAQTLATDAPYPLVIISHGYPGNRFLMSHLAENLASKGFVTVSIDHKDSTYDDQKTFASTLYNRPFDQLFVLNEIARLGKTGSGHFLAGLVDSARAGIVGYSMGGYGVVNVIGGGYSAASETLAASPPNKLLHDRAASNPDYQKARDPRIKAAIAIAPWGMQGGFWDADGLAGIKTPVLFVAGSVDDVAGYEKGTRAIYQNAVNADRYLLTFANANHNAAAPIPAPAETYAYSERLKSFPFVHYADAVWDTTRMNNILDHFATAYFDFYLKNDADKKAYLDLAKGFKRGTTAGLTLEHAPAAVGGQRGSQGPPVSVTVNGKTWTQQELFQRNIGARDDQTTAFPPHKVIGNIYYVGTKSLSSYLITTPKGHILVNSTYERNVPIIQKSIEDLGFKFSDVKILLGSHAHGDHQEGDALVKQLTGAQVVAMAEDVPALEAMKPGGKPHPIDRVIHDGDTVTLGGVTLTAHLTPGHTRGCTTWTMKVTDGGKSYDVVIMGSVGVNPGFRLVNNPDIPRQADEYRRAFQVSRALPCDVPLASHGAMYNMAEKYARLKDGGQNPFIDPAGYKAELDLDEAMFRAVLAAQQKELQ